MDIDIDFITSEILNILFFQQKNLVIFPHVDLKHLSALDNFTVGYNLIDLESTALFNLKEILINDPGDNYSGTPNFYLIYNLNQNKLKQLLELSNIKCILNVNENISHLADNNEFIFYNKKTQNFLNIDFNTIDLEFENLLISSSKNRIILKDKLQQIKNTASEIYFELNEDFQSRNLPKILSKYPKKYWNKIINFTSLYFQIEINASLLNNQKEPYITTLDREIIDFSNEYEFIIAQNYHLATEFVQVLHDFRSQYVNPRNLELEEIYNPLALYNYLRKHHWKKRIPLDFLKTWVKMEKTNYRLGDMDIMDLEKVLRKLKIPNEEIIDISNNLVNLGTQKIIKRFEVKTKSPKIELKKKNTGLNEIPSVGQFNYYSKWILDRLEKIEKIINSSDLNKKVYHIDE